MSSLDGQQRTEPGARRPPQQPPRLTQKEYEALKKVQSSVSAWRTGGFLAGSALATVYCRRKTPPYGLPATLALAFLGGWAGAFTAMPIGVFTSRSSLLDVEDPRHFKQVIEDMAMRRTPGQPSPLSRPPLPGADAATADSGFVPETPSNSPSASSFPPAGSGFPSSSAQSAASPAGAQVQGQQPDASRWAQIRGDRSRPSSTWDRIRGQSGGVAAGSSSAQGSGVNDPYPSLNTEPQQRSWPSSSEGFSGGSPYPASSPLAPNSSGGASSDSYQREQSEFDAMLARERRAAEDNQGAERLGAGFINDPAASPSSGRRSRWA